MRMFTLALLSSVISTTPAILQTCNPTDADGDGYTSTSAGGDDCNDQDDTIYPGADELCDEKDNNCDGVADNDPVDPTTFYEDLDGDGYGSDASTTSCSMPNGYSASSGDCNDSDASIHPGANEIVGDLDDTDCDGKSDVVLTNAGTGLSGYAGDGGLANAALLNYPSTALRTTDGSLVLSDTRNHCIRRVASDGTISTIAGTGQAGYSGDGGYATSAQLNYPRGIAVDSSGNLYISDSSNQRIRRVDATTRRIETVAGNGVQGYGGDGGLATSASLAFPYGAAVDEADNLLIADSNNHRIRLVDGDGIIQTVVGDGTATFDGDGGDPLVASLNFPRSITITSWGAWIIADTSNYRIRMVDSNVITTLAGSGLDGYDGDNISALSARLNDPYGADMDRFGNLFIADTDNNRIRRVDAASGLIQTVVGTGVEGYSGDNVQDGSYTAQVNKPLTVTVTPDNDLLIADTRNSVIRTAHW